MAHLVCICLLADVPEGFLECRYGTAAATPLAEGVRLALSFPRAGARPGIRPPVARSGTHGLRALVHVIVLEGRVCGGLVGRALPRR